MGGKLSWSGIDGMSWSSSPSLGSVSCVLPCGLVHSLEIGSLNVTDFQGAAGLEMLILLHAIVPGEEEKMGVVLVLIIRD